MRNIYIIDTSVLVSDPYGYKNFHDSDIILPIVVLDELDKLKKGSGAVARNARLFIRELDALSALGEIHKGVSIDNGITVKIDVSAQQAIGADAEYGDNQILATANAVKIKNRKRPVILLSRDINLRTRARAYGMLAEDYEKDGVDTLELYSGFQVVVNEKLGGQVQDLGSIENGAGGIELYPNECVVFQDNNGDGICVGRRVGSRIKLIQSQNPWGLHCRNKEQAFAVNLLLDPKVPLVSLIGRAGSGKTLIAIASALEATLERKKYDKLIIYRPIQAVGNDIGYLPGSLSEKLEPWMGAITDAMEFCFTQKSKDRWKIMFDMYVEKGLIELNVITHIRGRSIPNALILLDESQNISKEDIKTVLTRCGEGTKIVLTGDIEQIDNHHLDASNNGLTYVIDKFKNSELAGHITLSRGERSALATEAADIL